VSRRVAPLALLLAACSAAPPPAVVEVAPPPAPAPDRRPDRPEGQGTLGERATIEADAVVIRRPGSEAAERIPAAELHAAPGDRALHGIHPRALLYLDDGALLVGAEDGVVTILAGPRRAHVGLRGGIVGMARLGADLAAVTTDRGVVALVGSDGRVRWERPVTAERLGPPLLVRGPDGAVRAVLAASHRGVFALAADGAPLFTHAAPLVQTACTARTSRGSWIPRPDPTCVEMPADPPALALAGEEIKVGASLRLRLDGAHPPVPSLAPTFPLAFTQVVRGSVVSILADGPDAVLALVCEKGRDYGDYEDALVAQLRHACKVVRVAGAVAEVASLPDLASRKEVILEGTRADDRPSDLVHDALLRGPTGKPWVAGRKLSMSSFGCEDGSCGPPGGAGALFDLAGKKPTERRELFADFSAAPTYLPLVAASSPEGGILCWADRCASVTRAGARAVSGPDVGTVHAATVIAGRPWVVAEGSIHRLAGPQLERVATPEGAFVTEVAGTSEADVWATTVLRYGLLHFDGKAWTAVPAPPAAGALAARAADDVWSGRMHWDGARWSVAHGAPDAAQTLARGRDDVWMANAEGLWHGRGPAPQPVDLAPAPPDDGCPAALPLPFAAPDTRNTVARVPPVFPADPRQPTWTLAGKPTPDTRDKPAAALRLKALTLWEEVEPHAQVREGSTFRPVRGLPAATWVAVAASPDGGAWFAGGLGAGPSGEGILFHARGKLGAEGTLRVRAPASLLAVSAAGPKEAWAVGAAGIVVHVRDGVVSRQVVPNGEWLRAVYAGEDGVWMAGDGGTLLHLDAAGLHPVPHPLGDNATFTELVSAGGALWAFSPAGLLRIARGS
jgi:hypothetical protein